MRKIREVLRLSALGLAQRQIARSCSIVQSTVHKYLKLAEAAQIGWPLPENLTDRQLDQLLFGKRSAPPSRRSHPAPDFPAIRKELEVHKDLTLELVWREYKQAQPEGYRYSRFLRSVPRMVRCSETHTSAAAQPRRETVCRLRRRDYLHTEPR